MTKLLNSRQVADLYTRRTGQLIKPKSVWESCRRCGITPIVTSKKGGGRLSRADALAWIEAKVAKDGKPNGGRSTMYAVTSNYTPPATSEEWQRVIMRATQAMLQHREQVFAEKREDETYYDCSMRLRMETS